jgi:hypothetical protein
LRETGAGIDLRMRCLRATAPCCETSSGLAELASCDSGDTICTRRAVTAPPRLPVAALLSSCSAGEAPDDDEPEDDDDDDADSSSSSDCDEPPLVDDSLGEVTFDDWPEIDDGGDNSPPSLFERVGNGSASWRREIGGPPALSDTNDERSSFEWRSKPVRIWPECESDDASSPDDLSAPCGDTAAAVAVAMPSTEVLSEAAATGDDENCPEWRFDLPDVALAADGAPAARMSD